MNRAGFRTLGIFVAIAGLVAVGGPFAMRSAHADVAADVQIKLPADPRHVVLSWDARRADLPRNKDGPTLQVRADGAVFVTDPHGSGRPIEAKLSSAQLHELLRFVIAEQGVFDIDQKRLQNASGATPAGSGARSVTLCVSVDGRDRELHCTDPAGNAARGAEAARLAAIERRLERLTAWAYAGGDAGVESTLAAANAQLRRDFPDAPPLAGDDVRTAVQRTDGSSQVVFERRAVAADHNPFSFVYARVEKDTATADARVVIRADLATADAAGPALKQKRKGPFNIVPTPIAQEKGVNWNYPIVYVRVPRDPENLPQFANTHPPTVMPVGSELIVLHPDGHEDVLVPVGDKEAVTDPFVSFDGQWVYFVKFYDVRPKSNAPPAGSDIFKVHVATRKVVQLTHQGFTPNAGAVAAAATTPEALKQQQQSKKPQPYLNGRGVYNLGPCPAPGGKVVFTSDRNAFKAAPGGTGHPFAQQLFVMDDDGRNVENIGHLNLGGVLHPLILTDGRIIFTTNETQGLRGGYSSGASGASTPTAPTGTRSSARTTATCFTSTPSSPTASSSSATITPAASPAASARSTACRPTHPPASPNSAPPTPTTRATAPARRWRRCRSSRTASSR
jgi:hypothetical protein